MRIKLMFSFTKVIFLFGLIVSPMALSQEIKHSNKPPLHGTHWVAITGKPLAASAGALTFSKGGNAVDAACTMLAATATMWDTLGWGGETQALIHDPRTGEVFGINALGAAPSGATPEFFRNQGRGFPPDFGPHAAVTPGTPGGLMVMLANFGTMSLEEVMAPAMEMAAGYPIETTQAENIEGLSPLLRSWPDSRRVFLPNEDIDGREHWLAPRPGEIFRQPELLATLEKLVETERQALADGKTREEAIMAAYDRFYRGDIAEEIVRAHQAAGGLFTLEDLDQWQVYIEEPVMTTYKGIEVYKLNSWVQGPAMLQMLNILEQFDLQGLGYNSPNYIHLLYQAMNLAFADRDFYYGDPYYPPEEPIDGLLSKDYARQRAKQINMARNEPDILPGDPYPFQNQTNPFTQLLKNWVPNILPLNQSAMIDASENLMDQQQGFLAGTTSIQAADAEGWVVSITPSGAWLPSFIAGDTGIGLSQRMQSFVMDEKQSPFNVLQPGQRPRATLTPGMALKDGKPYLSFAVQGGDTQEQNLLQFFFNVVEFGMDVQQATEAANFNSYQVHSSFGNHYTEPGRLTLRADTPYFDQVRLSGMGYRIDLMRLTSGPINAILIDQENGTLTGGSSDYGDDYGVAW